MSFSDFYRADGSGVTLYISDLAENTSRRMCEERFLQFGPVKEWKLMMDDKVNVCRGFGFLTFLDNNDGLRFFHASPHFIGCQRISVALLNQPQTMDSDLINEMETTCIMVSYPQSTQLITNKDITEYFSTFGEIKNIVELGNGCTFIYYNLPSSIKLILRIGSHAIKNQKIIVKKVIKKEALLRAQHLESQTTSLNEV
uniref:RRM domain-containing protein n=1 Tax=Rhabditophanes sp. KR3021 TaxID=114890 RepID=A0AC35TMV9_9BILA